MNINQEVLLKNIYAAYDVEKWEVNDVQVWPIIKARMFGALLVQNGVRKKGKKKTLIKKFWYIFTGLLEAICILIVNIFKRNTMNEDIVLASYYNMRAFKFLDGRFYNILMDPIMDICKDYGYKVKLFEHRIFYRQKLKVPQYSPSILTTVPLFVCVCLKKILFRFSKFKFDRENEYMSFRSDMQARGVIRDGIPSIRELYESVYYILQVKRYFLAHINKRTCRLAILEDAQSLNMQGLILACRDLKIPIIEMQHGVIDSEHIAFSGWQCNVGYRTMPDYYFCWDEASANVIRYWANGSKMHRVYVIGDLWKGLWKSKKYDWVKPYFFKIEEICQKYINQSKILISLQGDSVKFPDYVEDVIQEKKEYFWIVRAHPTTSYDELTRLESVYDKYDNVFFDTGDALPLPAWLEKIDLHITMDSTVIIDAAFWGVKTISVDVEDRVQKEFINLYRNGYLKVAHNEKELMNFIKTSENKENKEMRPLTNGNMEKYFIETIQFLMK